MMYNFKDKKSYKKGIEREIVVAFPSCQCRVSAHITRSKTPHCQPAQTKNGCRHSLFSG